MVAGVHLTGDPITVATLLGVVGLAGVSVNDSIVLVDFANQNRRAGMSLLARCATPPTSGCARCCSPR
ncbi:MAG: hypothetical protein KatS3mg102_2540 [Planctomycetota bacterium]|nr:MAG: hypothetical protein KatS3mg102_2540 [Planctomycetota bacterium]